jgi:hypothetical protein
MEEIWKDIEGYEGLYQISNIGNIKSLDYNNTKKEKIMKVSTRKDGYQSIVLTKNGKPKQFYIHRLVAETFIPNPDNLPLINHKDCNPSNNTVSNIEWASYSHNNSYDGAGRKRREAARKNNSFNAPKYCYVYNESGKLLKKCSSMKEASDYTHCNYRDVWKICNSVGKAKSIHGFSFKIQ